LFQHSLFISESSSCGKGLGLEPTHIATIKAFFTHRFITMKLTALQIVGRTLYCLSLDISERW
jgi:hypothetical protein